MRGPVLLRGGDPARHAEAMVMQERAGWERDRAPLDLAWGSSCGREMGRWRLSGPSDRDLAVQIGGWGCWIWLTRWGSRGGSCGW